MNLLFLDSTYKGDHKVFIFLCLTYLPEHNTLYIHPYCHKCHTRLLTICQPLIDYLPYAKLCCRHLGYNSEEHRKKQLFFHRVCIFAVDKANIENK